VRSENLRKLHDLVESLTQHCPNALIAIVEHSPLPVTAWTALRSGEVIEASSSSRNVEGVTSLQELFKDSVVSNRLESMHKNATQAHVETVIVSDRKLLLIKLVPHCGEDDVCITGTAVELDLSLFAKFQGVGTESIQEAV